MNLNQQRAAAIKAAQDIIAKAEGEKRALTGDEITKVKGYRDQIEDLNPKIAAADESDRLLKMLAGGGDVEQTSEPHTPWADSVTERLKSAAAGRGVKALLDGQISTPPATPITPLPTVPTRLIDLIPKTELNSNHFEFLVQTAREENAAPVADGAPKPTSIYTFTEREDRARVIAHLSEPFPIRYLDDHAGLAAILDQEMREGVLRELEHQIINGDGTGENFSGLLHTTGVREVPFTSDEITTIRSARSVLGALGEFPTAWVFHPNDLAALDLTREDGATGGFLMDAAAVETIFGPHPRVESYAVPEGTALLADWRTVILRIRQAAHTLAATQADGLWETNQVKLRAEGRFGLEKRRPQALAVVELAA